MKDACILAANFFNDLAQVFSGAPLGKISYFKVCGDLYQLLMRESPASICLETSLAVDSLTKGAKHKLKEKEKSDKK